ncbi:MAG TPA: heme biosynthesis HemY N-terminal domain-containing protein, partial [Xanthomonadaceae bacterium]|nr:heme biosynthesis HemY N-terminal domain-containing protein [Xanthomonadaceae bacterium]
MKLFRGLLLYLALAVLGAVAWKLLAEDRSQVIVSLPDTIYSTTVTKALAMLAVALFLAWLILWLLLLPMRLWNQRRRRQARVRIAGGMLALHEGRWSRAEKLLTQAADDPTLRLPARLGAAHAALARGDAAASDQHLLAADTAGGESATGLARADALLASGRAQDAIAILDASAQKT